jgi:hypothetical protein
MGAVGTAMGVGPAADRQELLLTVGILGVMSAVYPTVGAFIVSRQPGNAIGWLLSGAGLSMSIVSFAGALAKSARGGAADGLAPSEVAAWVASWAFVPALALAGTFLLLLFPTGHAPGSRWRPVIAFVTASTLVTTIGYAFRPGRLALGAPIDNPFGFEPAGGLLRFLAGAGDVLFPLAIIVAAASMVIRFRDAGVEERLQLKWFAYAAVALSLAFAVARVAPFEPVGALGWTIGSVALAALPLTVAVAVMRYRLYDIDLIINRTLVYLALVGILGGLYAASIAFFQRVFVTATGDTSDAAVVITTLVLAGVFTPIRKALEGAVDRRFKPHEPAHAPPARGGLDGADASEDIPAVLGQVIARLDAIEDRLGSAGSGAGRSDRSG